MMPLRSPPKGFRAERRPGARKPKEGERVLLRGGDNVLRSDPTRTTTLRGRFGAEVSRRLERFRRSLLQFIEGDSLDLLSVTDQLSRLQRWLDSEIPSILAGEWWLDYVIEAYTKGVRRSYEEVAPDPGSFSVLGGAKEQFVRDLVSSPQERIRGGSLVRNRLILNAARRIPQFRGAGGRFVSERVHLLAQRFESELKGVTTAMAQKIARDYADGMSRGLTKKQIARMISDSVGISRNRALTIVRTETVRDHAEGQLDAMEKLGVEEVEATVEWVSAGNACPTCAMFVGKVYKVSVARGMIPAHPNCRCAWKANKRKAKAEVKRKVQDRKQLVQGELTEESLRKYLEGKDEPQEEILKIIRDKSVDSDPVLAHGMPKAEKVRKFTYNGVEFYYAAGQESNVAATLGNTVGMEEKVPPKLWKENSRIIFTNQRNRHDEYWEKQYNLPGFRSGATGGDGQIVVYNRAVAPRTINHESGHNLATRIFGDTLPPPTSRYGKAQQRERPVSGYGASSPAEDFAEAVRMYASSPATREELRQWFPLKYEALKEILGEV